MGVVYIGREGVDRTWYDTIIDWHKELQRRGCRIILGGHIRKGEQGIKGNKEK